VAILRTVGHGTLDAADFLALVRGAGIATIADVRRYPGSRRYPHFARDAMAAWLPEGGVAYRWMPALGGRRRPDAASPHVALRNAQFRAYADHMETPEFTSALAELLTIPDVAVMCSESLWWRCHRRLIADHVTLVEGGAVEHLFHDGRLAPHPPTPGARREGARVLYDG
jgi:uncharacterized protein (DUF488 family)